MDGWYYRTFDIDFGPVSHEKLVELIKAQSISREDEVRFGIKGGWRRVGSIGTLMAHLPFESGKPNTVRHGTRAGDESATAILESPSRLPRSSDANFSATKPDGNQWWCRIHDEIFGPVDMAKVIEMAQSHVISRDDEVRFGEAGIWRRVGSIGPLMAHLPFESRENVVLGGPRKGPSDALISTVDSDADNTGGADNSPNVGSREIEDRWWCRIENREYGPIELTKVFEWAATGRLLKSDEVRFGRDPYMAAGELAGLFPEEPAPVAPQPPAAKPTPTPKSAEVNAVTPATKPAVVVPPAPVEPAPKPTAAPQMSSGGFSSPSSSASRPAVPFRPPVKAKGGSGGGDLVSKLIPIGIGVGGLVGVVAAIYFGMMLIPESKVADQNRLKILQGAFDQLANVRRSGASKPDQFAPVKEVLDKAGKAVAAELKDIADKKPHQAKLNYVAKKLQDLAKDKIEAKPNDVENNIKNALADLETKLNSK